MIRYGILALSAGIVVLSGCSSYEFKRATYDALHNRQCIEQTGEPHCDPDRPSYDEYRRQADEAGRQDRLC